MTLARRVGRNTAFNVAGRLSVILVWMGLTPGILERLGPERFGYWSVLAAIGGALTLFDLGLGAAVVRYSAALDARGQGAAVRGLTGRAILLYGSLALALALVGVALAPFVPDWLRVPAAWRAEGRVAFLIALAGFIVSAVANVALGALQGLQRMDLSNGLMLALSPVLWMLVATGLARPDPLTGVVLAQALYGLALTAATFAALGWVTRRAGGPPSVAAAPGAVQTPRAGDLLRFGGPLQVAAIAGIVHQNVDKLLLAATVGLASVAPYELGFRISNAVATLPLPFLGAFVPAATHRDARTGGADRAALYRRVLEPWIFVLAPMCVFVAQLSGLIVQAWLGRTMPDAALACSLVIVTAGVTLVTGIATSMARAGGRPGLEMTYGLVTLALHVPLSVIGIRFMGWTGTLAGGLVATLLGTTLFLAQAERWLEAGPPGVTAAMVARACVPAGAAAAATALAVRAVGAGVGRPGALRALLVGGTVFVAVELVALAVLFPTVARALRSGGGALERR